MKEMQDLFAKLPAWTEWSKRDDIFLGSALDEFNTSDTDKAGKYCTERALATELIEKNGNTPYIRYEDLNQQANGK